LLELDMTADDSIARLAVKLDAWLDSDLATFTSQDRAAQGKALLRGFEIVKEFDRLKAEGLAAITALLNPQENASANERSASLFRGFEFSAKLAHSLHDELLDTEGETKVRRLMDAIVLALNTIGSGRAALAVLLDHPDAGVRALAGAYLIDLMPDRVVPVLRQIDEKGGGRSADFTAHWALLAWELEKQSRFTYLTK
jgi:hypothetical protein